MHKKLFFFVIYTVVLAINNDEVHKKNIITPVLSNALVALPNYQEAQLNSTCSEDYARFIFSVKSEEWAGKMYDSVERMTFGTLYGRFIFFGNFDECISANAFDFKGKHCMVDVIFGSTTKRQLSNYISYGVCIPSTCTAADILLAIGMPMSANSSITIQANDNDCWTNDPIVLTYEDWIVAGFFCLIGLIVLISTILDVLHRTNLLIMNQYELSSSFSLYRTIKQLMEIKSGSENIGCLHGLRSLTMFWIILNHEYMHVSLMPVMNVADVFRDFLHNKSEIVIVNGFLAVDTFLLLSGLLVTFIFFRRIHETTSYDFPAAVIHRFIRMTPALAAVVLFHSTIIIKIGKGPMWNRVMAPAVERCREIWWSGLVYLENILTPKTRCLSPSWYLTIDMQMFWLSPLLLYPLFFWPKKSVVIIFSTLAVALTINFMVSYIYQLGPHMLITQSARQLDVDYIQTHMRMTPYIVGMGLGYLLCGIKSKKIIINLSKKMNCIGWLLSAGLCFGSMYGVIYFIDNDYRGEYFASSSYLTFHRLGWSVGIAWVIFACYTGYGGPVNDILSWNEFQIIGRISYSMFLVHTPIQMCKNAMTKTNFYLHDFFLVSNFFSTLVFSILISTFLYLFIEAPFINIDKQLLRNLKILPIPKKDGRLFNHSRKRQSTIPQMISIEVKNW